MYVINLGEFKPMGTYLIALYVNGNNIIYFNSLGVDHIPKEIKTFIRKQKYHNKFCRIQVYYSIMCGYFCVRYIDFMLKRKSFLDYTNSLSPNDYDKNDKIILNYFQQLKRLR